MERLTAKKGSSRIKGKELVMSKPVYEKLNVLEDVEEQKGMPLDVWHRVNDGEAIYFIGNGRITKVFLKGEFKKSI